MQEVTQHAEDKDVSMRFTPFVSADRVTDQLNLRQQRDIMRSLACSRNPLLYNSLRDLLRLQCPVTARAFFPK